LPTILFFWNSEMLPIPKSLHIPWSSPGHILYLTGMYIFVTSVSSGQQSQPTDFLLNNSSFPESIHNQCFLNFIHIFSWHSISPEHILSTDSLSSAVYILDFFLSLLCISAYSALHKSCLLVSAAHGCKNKVKLSS
jgi:hypothetical protein